VGRSSAASRRSAGVACALMLAAVLVRLLTLSLPVPRSLGEVGLSVAVVLYALDTFRLVRNRWIDNGVVVVARSLLAAILAGGMVGLAVGHPRDVEVVALLLFTAVHISAPARARAAALAAATLVVDGVFAAVWLLWAGGDVLGLLVAITFMAGLQLVVLAQAKAATAATDSQTLRSSAHAAAAARVGTAIDVLGVTRAILETSRDSYPMATHALVYLYDSAAGRLRPLPLYLGPSGVGPVETENLDVALAPGEGLAGKVFAASRPMVWHTASDVHLAQADVGPQSREQLGKLRGVVLSAIGAPLTIDDEVIGVYVLSSRRQELVWGEEDITVVAALADEAARAIKRARRYERELDQAHLDSITGLANHRQLTRTLDKEVARARRRSTTLGVVFCDLDRFKAVNDTYGHSAGDRVLTILAQVFNNLLRREDSAARYGGDEFVCVLPGADHEEAAAVGRRISSSFELLVREDPELSQAGVTISCGVAIFPDDADGVDALLGHADAAMREIKAGHRLGVAESRGGG
jgi:diguanylate cyclase (GGDEF)-like protein